jgi:hypothetical protein
VSGCDLRYADGERCGAPAVAHFEVGCVHEHIKRIGACADDALDFVDPGTVPICWECANGPGSHACELLARRVEGAT